MNPISPPITLSQHEKFIDKINEKIEHKEPFFSFEYFPPRTQEGLSNLYARFKRMGELGPLFMDITWGTGGQRSNKDNITIEIADHIQNTLSLDCNMHLTCNTSTKEEVIGILNKCKSIGIRNILALRGDPPREGQMLSNDFKYARDLVSLIKEEYGDYFCISVAGYPYIHPECDDYHEGIEHLKKKVESGADFVISQLFYRAEDYFTWERDCRSAGITCPIIPGILPIQNYNSLRNMSKMCNHDVPKEISEEVEKIKDDETAIRDFGVKYAVDLCRKLLEGGVPGLHFYTLNREVVTGRVLSELGLLNK